MGSKRVRPVHLPFLTRLVKHPPRLPHAGSTLRAVVAGLHAASRSAGADYDEVVLTRATDTTADAAGVQAEAYRRMGPEGRLLAALEMSEEMGRVLEDGVRARHPGYSEDDVRLAAIRLRLGDALFWLFMLLSAAAAAKGRGPRG